MHKFAPLLRACKPEVRKPPLANGRPSIVAQWKAAAEQRCVRYLRTRTRAQIRARTRTRTSRVMNECIAFARGLSLSLCLCRLRLACSFRFVPFACLIVRQRERSERQWQLCGLSNPISHAAAETPTERLHCCATQRSRLLLHVSCLLSAPMRPLAC